MLLLVSIKHTLYNVKESMTNIYIYIYNELFIDDDPEIDENIEFPVIDDNNKIVEMQDTEIYKHNESPYTEMDDDYIDQKMLLP